MHATLCCTTTPYRQYVQSCFYVVAARWPVIPSRGVHLSRSCILLKRINMSSKICHHRVPSTHTILVFLYLTLWHYSTGSPLTGALNAPGVGKICDSRPVSGFRVNDWWSAINNFDVDRTVVYSSQHGRLFATKTATHQRILFITASMDDCAENKTTEFNCMSMQR